MSLKPKCPSGFWVSLSHRKCEAFNKKLTQAEKYPPELPAPVRILPKGRACPTEGQCSRTQHRACREPERSGLRPAWPGWARL